MNPYVQAIHNVTHHPLAMIQQVIEQAERVKYPYYPVGTVQWDAWIIYRAIREYERLHEPDKSA